MENLLKYQFQIYLKKMHIFNLKLNAAFGAPTKKKKTQKETQ